MEAATGHRPPIMFVHGAWLSARSWENFSEFFKAHGFDVSAPEWPRKDGDVEELRESADEIKGLGLTEVVDHYEEQIQNLDEDPILIGHSFGGLIVELLLDRGLGQAGVAMSPAPPKGITLSQRRPPPMRTSATPSPKRGRSSTRRASRTSISIHRPKFTSSATSVRPSSSSERKRTTPSRPHSPRSSSTSTRSRLPVPTTSSLPTVRT